MDRVQASEAWGRGFESHAARQFTYYLAISMSCHLVPLLYPSFATQERTSMTPYLRLRNGHYYFRLRIPTDLHDIIQPTEILKSLRTKDRKAARIAASCMLPGILQVFTLTRTQFITQEQAAQRLNDLLSRKQKAMVVQPLPQNNTPAEAAAEQTIVPAETCSPKNNTPTETRSPLISDMVSEYIKDKQAGWTGKTLLEYQGYFKLLQDVLNVKTVAEVNRNEVRRLRDTLCQLPAHMYKRHPGKSIAEVLKMDNITPMSSSTVNKLLTLFGSIMIHCVKEGHLRDNPAEGLKIQKKKRPDEERKVYTPEDLKKIVAALPAPADKPERHWIPLIGMFSGMRLGEVCGLHLEDVREIDGIWCFDVNGEDDKRLKTMSSKRVIPLHPSLIQLGFLSFVDSMRGKGQLRLWPNLNRRDTDGYCHAIGKWFQRLNRKYVTTDPLKTFHSLRHTFADTLKQADVQEALISELMGHANGNITTGRYGKRCRPQGLFEAICKLDY